MGNAPAYAPVLRWKTGEANALRQLSDGTRRALLPIVELVPEWLKLATAREARLSIAQAAWDVREAWVRQTFDCDLNLPFLLDLHHVARQLEALDDNLVVLLFDRFNESALRTIPVVPADASTAALRIATELAAGRGVALRIDATSSTPVTAQTLEARLNGARLTPEDAHLVVDFGVLPDDAYPIFPHLKALMSLGWLRVVVAAGSFPKNLGGLDLGENHVPRREWRAWKSFRAKWPEAVFADYTIRYAGYDTPPERGGNPTASIRYTCEDDWLVLKGQPIRSPGTPGSKQYAGQAMLLCRMHEYCGEAFSAGDRYIRNATARNPGNPQAWVQACVNHHVELVRRQVEDYMLEEN